MTMPGSPAEPGGASGSGAAASSSMFADRSLSLDDFVVLNDEIRAFVRAGIPISVGLQGTASRTDGLLRDVAARIAGRTAQGSSLPDAIEAEGAAVPAEYRALLTAGLRTGRLPDVLTSISDLGESVSRLRRQLRLSLIYPTIVFVMAYGLFVGLMLFLVPTFRRSHAIFRTEETAYFRALMAASDTVGIWGIAVPGGLAVLWALAWLARIITGGRASSMGGLRWLPGARDIAFARFAHVLSLLVKHSVPLPEAVRLSGDASGSGQLRAASVELARQLESGDSLQTSLTNAHRFPAFLKWLMAIGEQQGSLAKSLHQAANVYEQRALTRLDWFRRVVPTTMVLLFGGLITLTYALSVFIPLTQLLQSLGGVP